MIPQTQRWFRGPRFDIEGNQTDEGGDCFSACLASILEVPIQEFPNFLRSTEEHWWMRWQKWLYNNYRSELLYWEHDWPDITNFSWWIGNVMHGDIFHSVVFYKDEFRWDPAPLEFKKQWTYRQVCDVVGIYSIANVFDRQNGPPFNE